MRSKKLLGFLLTSAIVASYAAIAMPAAHAQISGGTTTNAQMFNPDNAATDANGNPLTQDLSSKPDGTDNQAHITSVATGDVTQANYYYCPNSGAGHQAGSNGAQTPPSGGTSNGSFLNPANNNNAGGPPSQCTFIGTDNSGVSAGRDTDEKAFEYFWTVPGNAPRSVQIVALHCVGAPTANEPGNNCVENLQNDVNLDSSGLDTSGEFVSWCVSNTSSCPSGANKSNFNVGGQQTLAGSFGHPTLLPTNNGGQHYIITATGSTDISQMTACWDNTFVPGGDPNAGADATGPPDDCTSVAVSNGGATTANGGRTFTFDFTNLNPQAGIEDAFYIYNSSGGSGACQASGVPGNGGPGTAGVTGNGCLLDDHYVVFEDARATSIIHTFQKNNSNGLSGNNSNVPSNAGCENPVTSATDFAGDYEDTLACAVDQFGRPFSGKILFETRGVGVITECDTGSDPSGAGGTVNTTPAPTNSGVANSPVPSPTNGYPNQTCVAGTATTASSRITTNQPGTQSVTACVDTNNNNFCDDSEPAATIVKTHQVGPARSVLAAWQGTGASGGSGNLNDCRTGTTFKNNVVGDTDTIVICTFDQTLGNNNPPPNGSSGYGGNPAQTTDTHLDYSIVGNANQGAGVSFSSTPPSTTGADGTTTAQIHADAPSNNTITVILRRNSDNAQIDSFVLRKDVRQNPTQPPSTTPTNNTTSTGPTTPRDVATNLTIRFNKKIGTWKGSAGSSELACQNNRHVTLWKHRRHHRGRKFMGDYTTRTDGNWHVVTGRVFGRFFATVDAAPGRTDSQGNPINCLSDKSVTIAVKHRHHH